MKRLAVCGILIVLCLITICLSQTAIDPDDFTGQWYSSSDQNIYYFHDGLINCAKYEVALSDTESISGAYFYCRDSVIIFAEGIDGLETEKELYLIHKGNGSFLCDHKDGSGNIYFIRYNK